MTALFTWIMLTWTMVQGDAHMDYGKRECSHGLRSKGMLISTMDGLWYKGMLTWTMVQGNHHMN